MFQHIVVPLDGSKLAECVLPHLVAVAGSEGTRVSLIRVLDVERDSGRTQPIDPLDWRISRTEAEVYLEKVTEHLKQIGVSTVDTAVLEGQAAQRIIEYAQQQAADLILVSSHGKSGVSRWNVSSVVRKIVQNANTSIMLVRSYTCNPSDLMSVCYRRILVPLDGSLRAEVALPVAAQLAKSQQAELLLAHIILRPELIQRVPPSQEDQELIRLIIDRSQAAATRYMDELQARLPVEFSTELQVSNNVSNVVQKIVDERQVDLIVMSAHGHSGDTARVFGSVAMSQIEYGSTAMITVQDLSPGEVEPTKAEEAAREHKGH